jgi:hypothetical protein
VCESVCVPAQCTLFVLYLCLNGHYVLWYACMCRVVQNHIYTVYIRFVWQGNHQIHGHIQCIYTVLANPIYVRLLRQ